LLVSTIKHFYIKRYGELL